MAAALPQQPYGVVRQNAVGAPAAGHHFGPLGQFGDASRHLPMDAWTADGGEQQTIALLTADRVTGRPILDVRQRAERAAGHIPGAVSIELGELSAHTDSVPSGVVVHCRHGERAMTAASLLQRAGHQGLAVLEGSPADWAEATGRPLKEGM